MIDNVFATCRGAVTALQAAEHYGIEVRRNGMACCPFHPDRTPSLKLYDNGSWYCFSCHRGGDSISFVGALFGLTPLGSVCKLDSDFNLHLPIGRPQTAQERREAAESQKQRMKLETTWEQYSSWKDAMQNALNRCIRIANCALNQLETPDDLCRLTDAQVTAIRWKEPLTEWSDCLQEGSMDEQMFVFRKREELSSICNEILNDSQSKSAVA